MSKRSRPWTRRQRRAIRRRTQRAQDWATLRKFAAGLVLGPEIAAYERVYESFYTDGLRSAEVPLLAPAFDVRAGLRFHEHAMRSSLAAHDEIPVILVPSDLPRDVWELRVSAHAERKRAALLRAADE